MSRMLSFLRAENKCSIESRMKYRALELVEKYTAYQRRSDNRCKIYLGLTKTNKTNQAHAQPRLVTAKMLVTALFQIHNKNNTLSIRTGANKADFHAAQFKGFSYRHLAPEDHSIPGVSLCVQSYYLLRCILRGLWDSIPFCFVFF